MVVAFKKDKFKNDTDPENTDTYNSDETAVAQLNNGKREYTLPKNVKADKKDAKNETDDCEMTKLYLTLTNIKNPTKVSEHTASARLLQTATPDIATL